MNSNLWRRRALRPRAFQIGAGIGRRQELGWLVRAHRAFEQGQYDEAAEIYEQLALIAEERGDGRAPALFFQAGRANLYNRQPGDTAALAQHGLELLAAQDRWETFERRGKSSVMLLERVGGEVFACKLKEWMDSVTRPDPSNPEPVLHNGIALPMKCPSCGGPVDPLEVEWLDESTVMCDFCGSAIPGEAA